MNKVGFALRIDDLPDKYKNKSSSAGVGGEILDPGPLENNMGLEVYDANIDTTFALYRPKNTGAAATEKAHCGLLGNMRRGICRGIRVC